MAVPADELPVILPENVTMDGINSPIKSDPAWAETTHLGQPAKRETDTFDTFMESSWYYARFCCPHHDTGMLAPESTSYWLPVDQYIGGIEHACMHLLYARFFHKLLRDAGLVKGSEPFKRLLCQGMVLADTFFYVNEQGVKCWVSPQEAKTVRGKKGELISATHISTGETLNHGGMVKMSKSKNNGIDPQELIEQYGADTVRLYTLFAAPPEQSLEWSAAGVEGAHRFLRRLWNMACDLLSSGKPVKINYDHLTKEQKILRRKIHETIQKVSDDYSRRQAFNTAIAAVMELSNATAKLDNTSEQNLAIKYEALRTIVLLLAPVTPHICHVIWQQLDESTTVEDTLWPVVDKQALEKETATIVVQVNGKVRTRLEVPLGLPEEEVKSRAMAEANIQKFLDGKEVKKIIVIPDKLINIVAG